ncbi:metal-sulfur cluster assembly factor [Limisphaera sp. VF-2]|jgi:metal-sulfur cluster biosynthetic enzyme|uniref:metal-sulfur cluster assembly factor n=1 Tax=Limisphaera sp. VF-2 TaxID=3400418 RepID=UPI001760D207|nr:metal-sulfur cluster assembly factor [Limisphaera sp.]
MIEEGQIWEALRRVVDPELDCNIVDLGLVYGLEVRDGRVHVQMTVTSPGCPLQEMLVAGVQQALRDVPGVADVSVEVVLDPPWHPGLMRREAYERLRQMG